MEQVFLKNGYKDPSHTWDLLRYSVHDLNNLLIQILFTYIERGSTENINQFLITISQQKLLDKILVIKEIWSIYYSLEEHKESSIDSDILHKIFNNEYNEDMIPFYVQSRKILIQIIFGDSHLDKNNPLENIYVSSDKLANVCYRIFERVIPDRGLSNSVGNVIRSIEGLSYDSQGQVSALDFLHFTLLEYQRLQLKAYHDDEVMHWQRQTKLAEMTVSAINTMFYRDPWIIIKNFDYENESYVPPSYYNTAQTNNASPEVEINEALLRISTPASRFQNNPPKTREEQRRVRNKEKHAEEHEHVKVPTHAPKVIKSTKNTIKVENTELNDREEHPLQKASRKALKDPAHNVFKQSTPVRNNSSQERVKKLESELKRLDNERGSIQKEIQNLKSDQIGLSPSKGSQAHLKASPSMTKIFKNGSERGQTSSHRSLYQYGSRSNIMVPQEDHKMNIVEQSAVSSDEEHKEDFSYFLDCAAHKPNFLSRSAKKQNQVDPDSYENYEMNKSPPELPPRDFNKMFRDKQDDEYSKTHSSPYPSKYDIDEEQKTNRRQDDREKRISVLDDVENEDYYH